MKKIISFIKSEVVLVVAFFLAIVSSFFVKPDLEYINYIDFRTLAILFCLMCVMAGLQKNNVFTVIAQKLVMHVKNYLFLMLILIFLCFFFSMLITNDVALITFVPFTFIVFKMVDQRAANYLLSATVVLQTIAANLGSMFTPIGNPQNLYLYELSKIPLKDFFKLMYPCVGFSIFFIIACCFILEDRNNKNLGITKDSEKDEFFVKFDESMPKIQNKIHIVFYCVLFVICLLTVSHILSYLVMLAIVFVCILFIDKKIFLKVDYSLLLTFVGFFIFVGNISRIPSFSNYLSKIIDGNEFTLSILLSQVISNVPTSLLLSGFTTDYKRLIVGTNLGGLGTLIASMASLISYKAFVKEYPEEKKTYLLRFTVYNILFLVAIIIFNKIMNLFFCKFLD